MELECKDCGNDDAQRMCLGICAECGGEIVDTDEGPGEPGWVDVAGKGVEV